MLKPVIVRLARRIITLVGSGHELSIAANGKVLKYQWQRDIGSGFKDIKGATKPVYNSAKTKLGDKPVVFRCLVTSKGGTTISGEVKATVHARAEDILAAQKAKRKASKVKAMKAQGSKVAKLKGKKNVVLQPTVVFKDKDKEPNSSFAKGKGVTDVKPFEEEVVEA
jgi:hypothetical protein